jgi:predicted PurR-regulated permease PerM
MSTRRLVIAAAAITIMVVAVAAAAMYFSAVWLDVIYAVVATWLLLPLLLGVRKRLHQAVHEEGNSSAVLPLEHTARGSELQSG